MQWALVMFLAFDMSALQNETNPEKRSDLALKNADAAVTTAREAYRTGDEAKVKSAFEEARQSIDICYDSLEASGKNPRGSRFYKQAELGTRQLLRRLDGLRDMMSVIDQEWVIPLRAHVSETHDKLLAAIMSKKKK